MFEVTTTVAKGSGNKIKDAVCKGPHFAPLRGNAKSKAADADKKTLFVNFVILKC